MAEMFGCTWHDHGVDRRGDLIMGAPARVVKEHNPLYDMGIIDADTGEPVRVTVRIYDGDVAFWHTTDPETARRMVDGTVRIALLLEDGDG